MQAIMQARQAAGMLRLFTCKGCTCTEHGGALWRRHIPAEVAPLQQGPVIPESTFPPASCRPVLAAGAALPPRPRSGAAA